MKLEQIKKTILTFDSNLIHLACDNLGYPSNWECFSIELRDNYNDITETYNLLKELVEVLGNEDMEGEK